MYCRIHKSHPFDLILTLMNPVHILGSNLFKIHFNTVLPSGTSYSVVSSLQMFRKNLYAFLPFPIQVTFPGHIILCDVLRVIIVCEQQNSGSLRFLLLVHPL